MSILFVEACLQERERISAGLRIKLLVTNHNIVRYNVKLTDRPRYKISKLISLIESGRGFRPGLKGGSASLIFQAGGLATQLFQKSCFVPLSRPRLSQAGGEGCSLEGWSV